MSETDPVERRVAYTGPYSLNKVVVMNDRDRMEQIREQQLRENFASSVYCLWKKEDLMRDSGGD